MEPSLKTDQSRAINCGTGANRRLRKNKHFLRYSITSVGKYFWSFIAVFSPDTV